VAQAYATIAAFSRYACMLSKSQIHREFTTIPMR
jgi:hypothetical protein